MLDAFKLRQQLQIRDLANITTQTKMEISEGKPRSFVDNMNMRASSGSNIFMNATTRLAQSFNPPLLGRKD